jgi:hypothetical protein
MSAMIRAYTSGRLRSGLEKWISFRYPSFLPAFGPKLAGTNPKKQKTQGFLLGPAII